MPSTHLVIDKSSQMNCANERFEFVTVLLSGWNQICNSSGKSRIVNNWMLSIQRCTKLGTKEASFSLKQPIGTSRVTLVRSMERSSESSSNFTNESFEMDEMIVNWRKLKGEVSMGMECMCHVLHCCCMQTVSLRVIDKATTSHPPLRPRATA